MFGRMQKASIVLCIFMLGSLAGGCASTGAVGDSSENDPYESFNRKMFALNDTLDQNVALPAAKAYDHVVPEPARDFVHNGLANLSEPVTFANDILQGEPTRALETFGRTLVNSTIGLAGIIDVATPMGLPEHSADFGETLAIYGVGEGPYLVLPLLGPSNPRDAAGHLIDTAFDPLTYVGLREKGLWMAGRQTLGLIDARSQNIATLDELRKSSVDLYATLRSLYRQHRNAEIHGGKPDLQNLPNI